MKLADFMKQNGLDDAAMAKKIGGCSEHAVKKWKYGERLPRLPELIRIQEITKGEVTAQDFMPSPVAEPEQTGAAA